MMKHTQVCDTPGCNAEEPELTGSHSGTAPRGWLKLGVLGGATHQVYDFCPACAAKLRAMMPAGPERPELAAEPALELEPEPGEADTEPPADEG